MRLTGRIVVAMAVLAAATLPSASDVIVLKNGKRIPAGAVREEGTRIAYESNGGEYSLPKSLVARVEKEEAPAAATAPSRATDIPLPPVPASPAAERAPLLPNGELDRDYLESLARQPALDEFGRRRLAALYLAAIDYEMHRGRSEAAVSVAQRAVSALPDDAHLLLAYGVLLLHKQQYQAAREWLGRAGRAAPDSPQVWKFLGLAEYFSDRTDEAIRAWRRATALGPDPDVQKLLERAQRETRAEANFQQAYSSHFNLRFEGRQVASSFSQEVLDALERHYNDLDRQFAAPMREPIPVILYTNQAYRDVTRAPAWTGALNDGRIRVPVEGLSSVTPELSFVLKHELVHSFVYAKTRGRCPTWLNEGLAQYLDGLSARRDRRLFEWWAQKRRLPWAVLEDSFIGLDAGVVGLAYAQSLAAVEWLVDRYGLHEVVRMLDRLAEGQVPEAAVQSVYRFGYEKITRGIGDLLSAPR